MNEIDGLRNEFNRVTDGPFWRFVVERLKKFRDVKSRDLEIAEGDNFRSIQGEIRALDFALGSSLSYDHILKEKADKLKTED